MPIRCSALIATLVLVMVALGSTDLHAQQSLFGIGPKAGLYLDGPVPLIGGVAEIPFTREWIIEPGVELVFARNDVLRFVFDGNLRYAFRIRGEDFSPYLLGGLGLSLDLASQGGSTSTQSDFRLNLGGGVTLNTRSDIQYWGGLKIFLLSKNDSDVSLQGGILFYL